MAKNIKTGGRQKGTPNKKTQEFIDLLGDYCPITQLIEIAKDEKTSKELKVKINLDLLSYIYPKRKTVQMNIDKTICKGEDK